MKKTAAVRACSVLSSVCVLSLALAVSAQAQNAAAPNNDYFNFIEADVFGGVAYYAPVNAGLGNKFNTDGLMGVRATENFWNYFGLEQSFTAYSNHNLIFEHQPNPSLFIPPLDIHVHEVGMNFLAYLTPRDKAIRPFFTIGAGGVFWDPSRHARQIAAGLNPALGMATFNSFNGAQATYGAGIKWQVSPHIGVRADLRASLGRDPNFGLPSSSTTGVYIENNRFIQGLETTIGMTFYFGRRGEKPTAPPPPPPPPPPAPPAAELNGGTISASTNSVCPGETVTLTSNASITQGHTLAYQWSVDGSNAGPNSSTYTFSPNRSGTYNIGLTVSDTSSQNPARAANVPPITVTARQYGPPTVAGVTASPSSLDYGQTANLQVNASASPCGGSLTYSWAAAEGAVTGTGPTAQFNSNGVAFNQNDRSRPQSKQVRVTATVTDSKGGTATGSTEIAVNLEAQARHFGDIVFPLNSARVNNCGKRVLIEQLYPELTSNANYDVVLVGHIDSNEAPRPGSNRNRGLDRNRVLNTAGVLSGGTGTCAALDRGRIRGVWVGATQVSETLPTSCAISTTAPRERRGAQIDVNEAKNRRVEIWLVPRGMALPPAAAGAQELPATEMNRIGCPK
jgi:outer membrane protein OmpA-like peptidoglycan-associated protein